MMNSQKVTELKVMKTLVVGLGSTGTQICNKIVDGLEWDYDSLDRVPWIDFICLETNANEKTDFKQGDSFLSLEIDGNAYGRYVNNPHIYDETIQLTRWADIETLRKIPDEQVTGGAGNIRMVGRLVLLHEENFNSVYQKLSQKIAKLENLSEAKAQTDLGVLRDGSSAQIRFADNGRIRIFVVGTLCGGTCSGLNADIGFLIRNLSGQESELYGIFTLPHKGLTSALREYAYADRYKKNAYHALLELNHYNLILSGNRDGNKDSNEIREIKWPNRQYAGTNNKPYNGTFIVTTRAAGKKFEDEINQSIADLVTLITFMPETDPKAEGVNAITLPEGNDSYTFSTFSMASMEYPAHRIIDACTKRLLRWTLKEWRDRELKEAERRLDSIGLTWNKIIEQLSRTEGGENIKSHLESKREEIAKFALQKNITGVRKSIDQIRQAFQPSGVGESREGILGRGKVYETFEKNANELPKTIKNKLREDAEKHLIDFYGGPRAYAQFLEKTVKQLEDIESRELPKVEDHSRAVDQSVTAIENIKYSWLLKFLLLSKYIARKLVPVLKENVRMEIDNRIQYAVLDVLGVHTSYKRYNPAYRTVINRVTDEIVPIKTRTENLRDRILTLVNQLEKTVKELAEEKPPSVGVSLFEPEINGQGTVQQEYEKSLKELPGYHGADWAVGREQAAIEIIKSWDKLPSAVVPLLDTADDPDWLLGDIKDNMLLDLVHYKLLEQKARSYFMRISDTNVLDKWWELNDRDEKARELKEIAKPSNFLDVESALAQAGGKTKLLTQNIWLVPSHTRREKFIDTVQSDMTPIESPDRKKIVYVAYTFNFPLKAVDLVSGRDGIHSAVCNDFPTFHTRKDLNWKQITIQVDEKEKKIKEIFAVGILLDLVRLHNNRLKFEIPDTIDGSITYEFPLSLQDTAKLIRFQERDSNNQPIRDAYEILIARIKDKRTGMAGNNEREKDSNFLQTLFGALGSGKGKQVEDYDIFRKLVVSYLKRDTKLEEAYRSKFGPEESVCRSLLQQQDDGSNAYVCPKCGGFIGKDKEEAASNLWTCQIDPTHEFYKKI